MLAYRQHVETTAVKCKKGLLLLKAMAAKGIEQSHLFLLYQTVVLRVQNEAMRVMSETHPLIPWGSCYTSHQCKPDRKWSWSKHTLENQHVSAGCRAELDMALGVTLGRTRDWKQIPLVPEFNYYRHNTECTKKKNTERKKRKKKREKEKPH